MPHKQYLSYFQMNAFGLRLLFPKAFLFCFINYIQNVTLFEGEKL